MEGIVVSVRSFLSSCINFLDVGLIAVDTGGEIVVYNEPALQIFGINPRIGPGHGAGKIERGDLVIIANNCLGKDDGNLAADDLSVIGVAKDLLKPGLGFATMGFYKTGKPAL